MRLATPLTECASIDVEAITSNLPDEYVNRYEIAFITCINILILRRN